MTTHSSGDDEGGGSPKIPDVIPKLGRFLVGAVASGAIPTLLASLLSIPWSYVSVIIASAISTVIYVYVAFSEFSRAVFPWFYTEELVTVVVGMKVRTRREFSGVPRGSKGIVDEMYGGGFMIAWDLGDRPLPSGWAFPGRASTDRSDWPLRDGFSHGEGLEFLEVA